jgi:site-specific DNA recombinase
VDELAGIEGQRAELAALWGQGGLTTPEWQAARGALGESERALQAELAANPPPPAKVTIEQARESWPSMTLDERRQFLRLFIEAVTISRATPGRKGFDAGRVAVAWRMASGVAGPSRNVARARRAADQRSAGADPAHRAGLTA